MNELSRLRKQFLAQMLRPLVRFCLRGSIGVNEVVETIKGAFVEVAAEELRAGGKKPNASRVSIATGLNRKDVARLLSATPRAKKQGASLLSRVLAAWEQDARFSTKQGKPRLLAAEGENNEFQQLVASVTSDVYYVAVLDELERNGVIERARGSVKLVENVHRVGDDPEKRLQHLARNVEVLIAAAEENMTQPQETRNVQLRTDYDNIFVSKVPQIRAWMLDEAKAFHKRVRDYLSQFDKDLNPDPEEGRAGATVMLGTFSLTVQCNEEEPKDVLGSE